MSESLIPPWITPADDGEDCEWLDDSGVQFRPRFGPGPSQRQSYGGPRLMVRRRHKSCRGEERSILTQALAQADGRTNVIRTKIHQALRGSFPATELLTNPLFENGTTGWTATAGTSLSVSDRVMRMAIQADTVTNPSMFQNPTISQYVPYVGRAMVNVVGPGVATAGIFLNTGIAPLTAAHYATNGMTTVAAVSVNSGSVNGVYVLVPQVSGFGPGSYVDVPYTSFSRCALVDNGPNALLRSDEFDNASWTKSDATVTADAFAAPDGTTTGDALVETATTAQHFVHQSATVASAAADFFVCVAIRGGNRTFCELQFEELTGGTLITQYFNITTKAVGASGSTGANWSNRRAFAVDLGNGWMLCCLGGRKTNAATALRFYILSATADGTNSYLGSAASNAIYLWRAMLAQSSVPTRLVQTTTTATTGTAQNVSAMYIKGLPASTSGLLLPDDWFEINGELKQCTAALNSDAAGLGYLQFKPDLVRSPADNDPIIILNPMGKFILASSPKKSQRFTTQSDINYDLEHIYE